jgi:hypothetical protein
VLPTASVLVLVDFAAPCAVDVLDPEDPLSSLPHAASVPAATKAARMSAILFARAPPRRGRARLMVLTQRMALSSSSASSASYDGAQAP